MHVYFGTPVSVRELANGRIQRNQYNLIPRDLPLNLSSELQEFVGDVAHLLVQLQERSLVLSPWSLMALVLLQNPDGVDWNMFTHKTLHLRTLTAQLGAQIDWPAQLPDSEVMMSSMSCITL
ncbi:hypothetical protein Q7C36_011039 [Tachysurus vachellii]|uniref:GPAT/DHAPAT C-terminal domain-containing protein n=1 Tax=Tachysurus vachellii TaxID=175792 RepID=A0AA88SXB3_TACVA|nr:hypothetical protein Q7C36_011039 [Tachysurus vachellii]